jgi:RNA polymerase sigma factor (sigma-70 family)
VLRRLLRKMDYRDDDGVFRHSDRQVIFVGDFVDRGPEQLEVLHIARSMCDAGTALAVMGNHEFNALSWAEPDDNGGDSAYSVRFSKFVRFELLTSFGGTGVGRFCRIHAMARFKALTALRRRRHEDIDQNDVREIGEEADTPELSLDRDQTNAILRDCVAGLSPVHREIINLIYYREKSVEEVGEMIGIPKNTVKSRMFYARKQLVDLLADAGVARQSLNT